MQVAAAPAAHGTHNDAHGEYPTPCAIPALLQSETKEPLQSSSIPVDLQETSYFGIEICSGTGGLTAQLRLHGLPGSFGIDHHVKAGCKAPICKLDLEKEENLLMILEWIKYPKCRYVHLGGTVWYSKPRKRNSY